MIGNPLFKAAVLSLCATPLVAHASTHGDEGVLVGIGVLFVAFFVGLVAGAYRKPFFFTLFQGLGVIIALVAVGLLLSLVGEIQRSNTANTAYLGNFVSALLSVCGFGVGLFVAGYIPGRVFIWLVLLIQVLFSKKKTTTAE